MPSMEESRRLVRSGLEQRDSDPIHDDIIASLQDEIDKHNAVKDDLRHSINRNRRREDKRQASQDALDEPSLKFRFKSTHADPRKRKHGDRGADDGSRHRKSRRRTERDRTRRPTIEAESEDTAASHPFPREPAAADQPHLHPNHAFRDSLFDALADDEGAQYWESVYSQPIHVYERPTVVLPSGQQEQMDDDAYAAYVKTKMWERKNPQIMMERERTERKRKEAEERSAKEREEYVRRKQQAAWNRAQTRSGQKFGDDAGDEDERYERTFAGEGKWTQDDGAQKVDGALIKEYARAWKSYMEAWDALKLDLLRKATTTESNEKIPKMAKRIPWPVLSPKPVLKPNIEAFMSHLPADQERGRLQLLKAERVRWHPDKIQQRFGGEVDEGTIRLVTGVFQVVDALYEDERQRASK